MKFIEVISKVLIKLKTMFKKKSFLLIFLISIVSLNYLYAQQQKPVLNFFTAKIIMDGCIAYADSSKLNMAIAIYDANGQLIHFVKMDGVSVGVAKVAQWKGLSAAIYQFSTEETGKWNVPTAPDIATVPGGLPIKTKEGYVIGGIGVSGAASSVDVKCAEAGLQAAGLLLLIKK
jgi:glc operon protein GlcG